MRTPSTHDRPRPTGRRILAIAAATCVALLGGPATVSADSATITVTDTAGRLDPAAGLPRVFKLTANSGVPARIYVKYRNVGGAPCAPSASVDTGENDYESFLPYGRELNGDYTWSKAATWHRRGPTMFCIWIASSSTSIAQPFTQVIDFRAPVGSLSLGVTPLVPLPGQPFTLALNGATETPSRLYVRVKAGSGCAPTYGSDSGDSIVDGNATDGVIAATATLERPAGQYTACAWVASSSSDTAPIVGPQSLTFDIVTPAPPPPIPVAPKPPACAVVDRAVRRGKSVRVRCYRVSQSSVRVRFKRAKRTVTRKLTLRSGVVRPSTRGLGRGTWRVSVIAGSRTIGAGRVSVRR